MCVFLLLHCRSNASYINECALGRQKNVQIGNEDERIVAPLLTRNQIDIAPHGMVMSFPKRVLNSRVIISSKDTRSTRKNDCTVSYKECGTLKYGVVEKFLLYPADSEESIRLAIIQELQMQPCSELQNLNFPPEIDSIKQLLCEDFFRSLLEAKLQY